MSIIRQRSKNLIVSGVIGFFIAIVVVLLMYLFVIRGNIPIIEWILMDSQLEVTTRSEPVEPIIEAKTKVYTCIEPILKDQIISRNQIQSIEVVSTHIPASASINLDKIIGKKALMDLEPLMIITDSMIRDKDLYDITIETVEIQEVRIPDILMVGDVINIRVHFPTGQDYTVVTNKEVLHIDEELKTFFIDMNEEEILSFSSAREDVRLYSGTELYITKENQSLVHVEEKESFIEISQLLRCGLDYELYPLNPNALALSELNKNIKELMDYRVKLDESLVEFFDQDALLYSYDIDEVFIDESEIPLDGATENKGILMSGNPVESEDSIDEDLGGNSLETNLEDDKGINDSLNNQANSQTNNQTNEQLSDEELINDTDEELDFNF